MKLLRSGLRFIHICKCKSIINDLFNLLSHYTEGACNVIGLELPLSNMHYSLKLLPVLWVVFHLVLCILFFLLKLFKKILIQTSSIDLSDFLQMFFHSCISDYIVWLQSLLFWIIACAKRCYSSFPLRHQVCETSFINDMLEQIFSWVIFVV